MSMAGDKPRLTAIAAMSSPGKAGLSRRRAAVLRIVAYVNLSFAASLPAVVTVITPVGRKSKQNL
jgi:hypothetical protein